MLAVGGRPSLDTHGKKSLETVLPRLKKSPEMLAAGPARTRTAKKILRNCPAPAEMKPRSDGPARAGNPAYGSVQGQSPAVHKGSEATQGPPQELEVSVTSSSTIIYVKV